VIPGWPYSFVAALGPGATSWTAPLDAVRLGPGDDATQVTAAQLREVTRRLEQAGAWQPGDPDIIVVLDCGYDAMPFRKACWGYPAGSGSLRSSP
jgi:DDE superfamily endonuclease